MSWTDVFPILTDEMVESYENKSTKLERQKFDEWFRVQRVENPHDVKHVVTTSLFWKNIKSSQPNITIRGRRSFMSAADSKKVLRFNPWEHYVEPLLQGAYLLHRDRDDVGMRVYLASDLEFLIPDLLSVGCEVRLMATPSIRHNPGAMWRFLALEEEGKLVTNLDSDRMLFWASDIERTEEAARMNLGWWRVPVWGEQNDIGNLSYRPILGCHFGTNRSLEAELLMKALIWNTLHEKIETKAKPPGCGDVTVYGSKWPDYGFDEWFLQAAVYPRAAFDGLLSFIPASAKSRLLPLDIEYAQWANRNSELVYFGAADGCCLPQAVGEIPAEDKKNKPVRTTSEEHDVIAYTYNKDCGLGEAAAQNIRAMEALGLTVDHRIWSGRPVQEPALNDPNQVYYHHWHPQPADKGRKWPKKYFGKAKHIAFRAYETDTVPPEFKGVAKFMSEIWVPSNFCRRIFSVFGKDVHVVSHAISHIETKLRRLPGYNRSKPLTVLFLFDAWSRLPRKNPEAVIRVFRKAFAGVTNVRLVIKAHHMTGEDLAMLQELCGRDHWITVINEFLPEDELNEMFESADMLLSLQRSEGFGLNLGRALARGLPIVTTGYGGHRDFCRPDNSFLVPYRLRETVDTDPSSDPYYSVGRWGDPNETAAVRIVKQVAKMIRTKDPEIDERRQRGLDVMAKGFSQDRLQQTIRTRLRGVLDIPAKSSNR